MREYAKIAPKFFAGEVCRSLRRLDPSGKGLLVWLYLQSSPHSNMLGLYYQPIPFMGFELGIGEQEALKGLQACIELKLCTYDAETFVVWVYDMAADQIAPELKATDLRCKGIQSDYDNLPDNPFLGPWFDRYAQAFHLTRRREGTREFPLFSEGAYQAPSKPGAGAGTGTGGAYVGTTEVRAQLSPLAFDAPIGQDPAQPEPPNPPAPPCPAPPAPTPPAAAARTASPKGSASAKGTRLPEGWKLPKPWGDWALAEFPQWSAAKVRLEGERFADHWRAKPGKDGVKLSWIATWRNWCRSPIAHEDDPRPTDAPRPANGRAAPNETTPTPPGALYVPPQPLTPDEQAAADARRREVMVKLGRAAA